jgi:hypothetical protein
MKSIRQPPSELLAALLDPDWFEEVDDYRQLILNVSKEDFPWIEFRPEQATTIEVQECECHGRVE